MANLEIERKYIIRKPLILETLERADMVQTYLTSDVGTRRVRSVQKGSVKKYYFTEKIRRTARTCIENERQIDEKEYELLLLQADPTRNPICKTRYYYPHAGLTFEIDVYPFWQKQCVMEVELQQEEQEISFPPDIEIIKEVTSDRAYKNFALAKTVPEEIL